MGRRLEETLPRAGPGRTPFVPGQTHWPAAPRRRDLGRVKPKEFHYRWEFDLRSSPRALWPLVADTNRFNRDAGVPALDGGGKEEATAAGRNARRRLRFSKFGVKVNTKSLGFMLSPL